MRGIPLWSLISAPLWLLVSTVPAVAGCSVGSHAAAPPSSSAAPASLPADSPPSTTPATVTATARLVEFGRRGGIAGLSDQVVIREDGGLTVVRGRPAVNRTGQLTAAALADLRRVLEDSGFAQLPKVQPAQGADLFTYLVIYRNSEIVAQDGGIVPKLRPMIAALSSILTRYG
jgi:hypothetical protein